MNVIIRRDCYEKKKAFVPFSVLAFVLSVQFSVLGASGPGAEDAPADMSGTALNAQEREAFHRKRCGRRGFYPFGDDGGGA